MFNTTVSLKKNNIKVVAKLTENQSMTKKYRKKYNVDNKLLYKEWQLLSGMKTLQQLARIETTRRKGNYQQKWMQQARIVD